MGAVFHNDDESIFEQEIKFLKSRGFARLCPFHTVIRNILYGKSYTKHYRESMETNLKLINSAIKNIRFIMGTSDEMDYTSDEDYKRDLWDTRVTHK